MIWRVFWKYYRCIITKYLQKTPLFASYFIYCRLDLCRHQWHFRQQSDGYGLSNGTYNCTSRLAGRIAKWKKNVQTHWRTKSKPPNIVLLKIVDSQILSPAVFEIPPGSHQCGCGFTYTHTGVSLVVSQKRLGVGFCSQRF